MANIIKASGTATDAEVISDKPAYLYDIQVISNNDTDERYLMLFDATEVPSNGAVPVWRAIVPAEQQASLTFFGNDFNNLAGANFKTGIVAALSSTKGTLTVTTADEAYFQAHFSPRYGRS